MTESGSEALRPWFEEAYRRGLLTDSKIAADAIPRRELATILTAYDATRNATPGFDVWDFLCDHYVLPRRRKMAPEAVVAYLNSLWRLLRHDSDEAAEGSTLLPLPHPYIVPGGRFREVYYWDSYFTLLGLRESHEEALLAGMVRNFAWQIRRYGFVPNGNRSYYLTRSQPPYFALMVELLAETEGPQVYLELRDALAAEYAFWMDHQHPGHHRVLLPDGSTLNRYFDRAAAPRPEAHWADLETARTSAQPPAQLFRHLRSAAESGWDFSSRWLADGVSLGTIETTEIVPVDLNALLHRLEVVLARAHRLADDPAAERALLQAAERRIASLQRYCWDRDSGFYLDYHLGRQAAVPRPTLAGVMPLFLGLATPTEADSIAQVLRERFLRPGGLVTSLVTTGQQWDAPNGWAPLQWLAISGLRQYGHDALAKEISQRWVALNLEVFGETGLFWEKYNVTDLWRQPHDGEYPSQVGFGWTNGVLLRLFREEGVVAPPARSLPALSPLGS